VDRETGTTLHWIRDTAFALRALHALGFHTEADDFLAFLGDVLEPRVARSPRRAYGPDDIFRSSIRSTVAIHRSKSNSIT